MFETLFFIILVPIIAYAIYYLFYTKIRAENEFATQVYSYLVKRYNNTSIVDYGGLASDPTIVSHDAGPFKILRVVVTTEREEEQENRDVIIKGEINKFKYEFVSQKDLELELTSLRYSRSYRNGIKIGISALDTRFNLMTNNINFAREVLNQSDLLSMIIKSYDIKSFKIYLSPRKPSFIQVRMETMNSNSFLQAFNLLLGSIGTLTKKGFMKRNTHTHKIQGIDIPEIKTIPTYNDKKNFKAFRKTNFNHDIDKKRRDKQHDLIIKRRDNQHDLIIESTSKKELPEKITPTKENYEYLFSSLTYRTKDIIYKDDRVIIETFSTDLPDITVKFLNEKRIQLEATSEHNNESDFELIIENIVKGVSKDWNKLWTDINISGPEDIIDSLKIRSGIAHKINKIGNIKITVKSRAKSSISYIISIPLNKESIELAYEILNDIMWIVKLNS